MSAALGATVYPWSLPLVGTLPGCPEGERKGLLLWLEQDGRNGLGDCAPLPGFSVETLDQATDGLIKCAQWLACKSADITHQIRNHGLLATAQLSDIPSSVVFAVEAAVENLLSENRNDSELPSQNSSNCRLMSGSNQQIIRVAEQFGDDVELIKIKVARQSFAEDITLIQQLDRVLADYVRIRLDGNRGWSLDNALAFAKGIPKSRIDFIEEPLTQSEYLPQFAAQGALPVALDESLQEQQTLPVCFEGLVALVVKPTLAGGIYRCRQLADFAKHHKLELVISSSYESPVGIGTLARLAKNIAPDTLPGLDTLSIFQENRIPREQLHALWSSDQR